MGENETGLKALWEAAQCRTLWERAGTGGGFVQEVREDSSEDRMWGGLEAAGENTRPRECGKSGGELRCKGPEGRVVRV